MIAEDYTTEDFLEAIIESEREEAREEALEEGQNGVLELMDQGWSSEKIKAYLKETSENTAHAR